MSAAQRLKDNGRTCDECGGAISRFTTKCAYLPQTDRLLCSVGGCAAAYRAQGTCTGCGSGAEQGPHTAFSDGTKWCRPCLTAAGFWPSRWVVKPHRRVFQVVRSHPHGDAVRSVAQTSAEATVLADRFNSQGG